VIRVRRKYIIELERTADDHIVGVIRRDEMSEPVRFSGWIQLLSLLERPLLAVSEPVPGRDTDQRRLG
jgi:hypothetical protein